MRATGMGVATAFARLGGAAAPSLVAAVASTPPHGLVVCTVLALVGGALGATFPLETAGAPLRDYSEGDGDHASPLPPKQ